MGTTLRLCQSSDFGCYASIYNSAQGYFWLDLARASVSPSASRTPLIGMAAAGRTGALILERPGLDRVFTLVVRTSAAVIEPRRIIFGQREANLGGAFGHILQFKNRVRNTIGIPRRATRNVTPIEGEGKIFRVRTRRKRVQSRR